MWSKAGGPAQREPCRITLNPPQRRSTTCFAAAGRTNGRNPAHSQDSSPSPNCRMASSGPFSPCGKRPRDSGPTLFTPTPVSVACTRALPFAIQDDDRSFTRLTVSPLNEETSPSSIRAALRFLEWLLAWNTSDGPFACSERESKLATRWHPRVKAIFVPNRSDETISRSDIGTHPDLPTVVAFGRASAQKDPAYFIRVVSRARKTLSLRAVWVGDADESIREQFASHDIDVTGWMPQDDARGVLESADLLVHTARWEGFPLALLEASAISLPIVVRSLAAFPDLSPRVQADSEAGLANLVVKVLNDDSGLELRRNRLVWKEYFARNTRSAQRSALLEAYGYKTPSTTTRRDREEGRFVHRQSGRTHREAEQMRTHLVICPTPKGGHIEHAADLAVALARVHKVHVLLATRSGASEYLPNELDGVTVVECIPALVPTSRSRLLRRLRMGGP